MKNSNNQEIIRINIDESKKIIKNSIQKEQLIIFFSKLLNKERNNSKGIKELFYLLFPYSEITSHHEILKELSNSNLKKTEGLELTNLEEHFIKTFISNPRKVNIQETKKTLEYLTKKYFTNASIQINHISFCELLLHARTSKNILNMQTEKTASIIFGKTKMQQKEKMTSTKRFLQELKKDIQNDN